MNQSIIVKHENFKRDLANVINHAGLPAFIVEYVLKEYLEETHHAAMAQYQEVKADRPNNAEG